MRIICPERKKNRYVLAISKNTLESVIYILCFIVLAVLMGFNTKMVDSQNYHLFYKYAQGGYRYSGIEIGFYLFMRVCAMLGLSYDGFLKIYAFCGAFLVYKSLGRISNKSLISIVLLLYCPFIHIMSAVRNYMAWAILIWAIQYIYLDSKSKGSIVKFIICILVASTFHTVSLFYLVFCLYKIPIKKIEIVVLFSVCMGILLLIFNQQIYSFLIVFIPKLSRYLALGLNGTRTSTKLFLILYFMAKYILCILLVGYTKGRDEVLLKINYISALALPICMCNMNFMRIEYNVMIIMSVYVFNIIPNKSSKYLYSIKCLYILFYLIVGFFLMYLYSSEIVKLIWSNNSFLDLIF